MKVQHHSGLLRRPLACADGIAAADVTWGNGLVPLLAIPTVGQPAAVGQDHSVHRGRAAQSKEARSGEGGAGGQGTALARHSAVSMHLSSLGGPLGDPWRLRGPASGTGFLQRRCSPPPRSAFIRLCGGALGLQTRAQTREPAGEIVLMFRKLKKEMM